MASITYGWDLEIILRALDISNNFSEVTTDSIEEHRDELHQYLRILSPKLEDYPDLDVWLMCLQDSEIDLMESKMVGISSMIGGYVPELFLSLIHISEPTRQEAISYAVFCLKKKKTKKKKKKK